MPCTSSAPNSPLPPIISCGRMTVACMSGDCWCCRLAAVLCWLMVLLECVVLCTFLGGATPLPLLNFTQRRKNKAGNSQEATQVAINKASRRRPQQGVQCQRYQIKPRLNHIEEAPTLPSQSKQEEAKITQAYRDSHTCTQSRGARPPGVCTHTPSHTAIRCAKNHETQSPL